MVNLADMVLPPKPQFQRPICTRPASTAGGGNHADDSRPIIEDDEVREVRGYKIHCIKGNDYLSTSTVLSIMRWGDLNHVDAFALEYGRMRGSYVDQACQCSDQGCLGEIEPSLAVYVSAWEQFKMVEPWENLVTEGLVISEWSRTFGYRDRYGIYNGHPTVLDIKTSDFVGTGFMLQLASYLGGREDRAADVQLKKNGQYEIHWLERPFMWRRRWEALAHEAHEYIKEEEARELFYKEKRKAGRRK